MSGIYSLFSFIMLLLPADPALLCSETITFPEVLSENDWNHMKKHETVNNPSEYE